MHEQPEMREQPARFAGLVSRDDPKALRETAARMRGMAEGFEQTQRLLGGAAETLRRHGGSVRTMMELEKLVRVQQLTSRHNAVSARQTAAAFDRYADGVERARAALHAQAKQMPMN